MGGLPCEEHNIYLFITLVRIDNCCSYLAVHFFYLCNSLLISFTLVSCWLCCLIYVYVFCNRYVHNNIFFSFAVDADLEQLSKNRTNANSKTCIPDTLHSSSEKSHDSSLRGDSQVPNGGNDSSSLEVLPNCVDATQDIPPETQLAENEQATYASANNDLKGTKAYQEADVPGLYNLAMAIIDYRGHRVVAQVCCEAEIDLVHKFLFS